MSAEFTMSWHEANQDYLMRELDAVRRVIQRRVEAVAGEDETDGTETQDAAVITESAELNPPPASETLPGVRLIAIRKGDSAFVRRNRARHKFRAAYYRDAQRLAPGISNLQFGNGGPRRTALERALARGAAAPLAFDRGECRRKFDHRPRPHR